MAYMLECFDKPDSLSVRQEHRAAHLDYLEEKSGILLLAGAKWTDDGSEPLGSILIVDVETRAEAEAFAAGDPFSKAGLFAETRITHYRVAFLDQTNRLT